MSCGRCVGIWRKNNFLKITLGKKKRRKPKGKRQEETGKIVKGGKTMDGSTAWRLFDIALSAAIVYLAWRNYKDKKGQKD